MAQTSKPCEMYKLAPYYDTSAPIELPTNMYGLRNIHGPKEEADSMEIKGLEKRQEEILARLNQLKAQVEKLTKTYGLQRSDNIVTRASDTLRATHSVDGLRDVVISAHPSSVPLSLFVLYPLLQKHYTVFSAVHTHCSANSVSNKLREAFQPNGGTVQRSTCQLAVTLIWKAVKNGPSLMVNPSVQSEILGESNIARYLSRLLPDGYESSDIITATEIDTWLDAASLLTRGNQKEKASVVKNLNVKLGKASWLVGDHLTLADIVAWSAVQQTQDSSSLPANVKKWFKSCNETSAFALAQSLL